MDLNSILEALKEKGIDAVVMDAVKDLDQSAQIQKLTKDLEAERGKHAGILEDKRKFKERAETAEATLKDLQDKDLSAEERMNKQVAELQKKLDEAKAASEQQANEFRAQQRESALADITGQVRWVQNLPHDTAKLIIRNAFSGIEDLSKENVDSKLKEVIESHKAFIAADAPGGTGGKPGAGAPPTDKPVSMLDITSEIWPNN